MDFITPPNLEDGGYGYALFMFALIIIVSLLVVYALKKASREVEERDKKLDREHGENSEQQNVQQEEQRQHEDQRQHQRQNGQQEQEEHEEHHESEQK